MICIPRDCDVSCQDREVSCSMTLMRYSTMSPFGVEGGCQVMEMETDEAGVPVRLCGGPEGAVGKLEAVMQTITELGLPSI